MKSDMVKKVLALAAWLMVGVVTGVAAALALSRLIESQLYGVEGTDVLTYLTLISLLVGVALLGIFVPARRATQIDPVETLRAE